MTDKKQKLNLRQQRFIDEYIISDNLTSSYKKAGYTAKNDNVAASKASRLVRVGKIAEEIERRKQEIAKGKLTPEAVLAEQMHIGFADISQAFDEKGILRHPKDMPEGLRRAISGIDVQTVAAGTAVVKVRFWNKTDSLIWLGTVLGMVKGKGENALTDDVVNKLFSIEQKAEDHAKRVEKESK